MNAIAALYGSSSSDTDDASDAEPTPKGQHVTASASAGVNSSTDDEGARPAKKKRRADESPPRWKRAFAHVDGNWPSHVRVDIVPTEEISNVVDVVVASAQRVVGEATTLVPMMGAEDGARDFHLSLSRPFVLTYEQIEPFVEALRAALKWRSRFQVALGRAIVLVNDEATRSFLALELASGAHHVVSLLKCVDKCMREFGLQTYYEDPIPHVSIASAVGDSLRGALSKIQLGQLHPESQAEASVVVRVASVRVVIGNKQFHIPLR